MGLREGELPTLETYSGSGTYRTCKHNPRLSLHRRAAGLSAAHARTHARTHTHVRTYAHTHAHKHTHTYVRTHTRTHTHTCTHTRTHARTHAHTHARTHAHTHTHVRTHARAHTSHLISSTLVWTDRRGTGKRDGNTLGHIHTHTHTRTLSAVSGNRGQNRSISEQGDLVRNKGVWMRRVGRIITWRAER